MPWFELHTDERVHGVYHVEAPDAETAKRMFSEQPHKVGEQVLYEATSAQVERVEPLP